MPPPTWQERVRMTAKFHKERLRLNPKHTIRDTAKTLDRSCGSINEDLTLSSWMDTHSEVEKCESIAAALKFVRAKKYEMRIR